MNDKEIIYVVTGKSESGDHYEPVRFNHKPTKEELVNYIKTETSEELDCGGPGDFGSYVYLKVEKL